MRFAHVDPSGRIVNVIEADDPHMAEWVAPEGHTAIACPEHDIGDSWDGEKFEHNPAKFVVAPASIPVSRP